MRLIKENVEREADGAQAKKLLSQGFKLLDDSFTEGSADSEKPKELSDMKVGELKELAKKKSIEGAASLNKEELLAVLKDVV